MAWAVWWALVLGFAISAIVQAWVPRERIQRALGGGGLRPIARGHRAGRGLLLLLLRGDRDRQVALSEGRLGRLRACLPVRLHQPRGRARHRHLGSAGLAVHARRVRRRPGSDRSHDLAAAPVRLQAPGGASPQARPAGRQRSSAPLGRRHSRSARAAHLDLGLVGRGPQLPQRLVDALQGDHLGFLLAGFIGLLDNSFFNSLSSPTLRRRCSCSRT